MSSLLEIAKDSRTAVNNNTIKRIENSVYDVEVKNVELKSRKDGQGSYILMQLKVLSDKYKGAIIPEIVSFHPYRIKSSIYKLEEMLDSCGITLSDDCYRNAETLCKAVGDRILGEKIHIRFYFETGHVRIDYLYNLNEADDLNEFDGIDLSE